VSTAEHLAFAFALLGLGGAMRVAHRLWHDGTSQFDEGWPTWPLGARNWRGFVRAFPTFATGNFVSLALAWPLVALEGRRGHERAVDLLTLLTAATFLLTLGLTALIMTTGRRIRLVPPHLRDRDDDRQATTVASR
jgi:hypothetical protein